MLSPSSQSGSHAWKSSAHENQSARFPLQPAAMCCHASSPEQTKPESFSAGKPRDGSFFIAKARLREVLERTTRRLPAAARRSKHSIAPGSALLPSCITPNWSSSSTSYSAAIDSRFVMIAGGSLAQATSVRQRTSAGRRCAPTIRAAERTCLSPSVTTNGPSSSMGKSSSRRRKSSLFEFILL